MAFITKYIITINPLISEDRSLTSARLSWSSAWVEHAHSLPLQTGISFRLRPRKFRRRVTSLLSQLSIRRSRLEQIHFSCPGSIQTATFPSRVLPEISSGKMPDLTCDEPSTAVKRPKVSVIVPVYNAVATIEDCV